MGLGASGRPAHTRWLFAGTGVGPGGTLSNGGIEVDAITSSSPKGTTVVAEIPDLLGPGMTAQMTYYETRSGARVFAAGAFTLAGAVFQPDVKALMENLWRELSLRARHRWPPVRQPLSAGLGSLRAWPHGYHARSPQESPPGDRGRHRRRRHACRSVPSHRRPPRRRPRTATYGWPRQAIPPAAPRTRVLRRPAHRDDAEGHAQQLPLRDRRSRCPNGTAVYATLDGVVRLESFRPGDRLRSSVVTATRSSSTGTSSRPSATAQRVKAYVTVVGWAEPPWEHVHFSERRDGVYVNPLRPGALGPFADTTTPWLEQLRAEVGGRPVSIARGAVDLVVEAYDETPIRVPGRWGGKPVTPALLRWRVTTAAGRVAAALALGDRLPPHDPLGRPLLDAVRPLDAPEQEEPARPLPLRPPVRLGQPHGRRRSLRRRGRSLRSEREQHPRAVPDPRREPLRHPSEPVGHPARPESPGRGRGSRTSR